MVKEYKRMGRNGRGIGRNGWRNEKDWVTEWLEEWRPPGIPGSHVVGVVAGAG